RRLVFVVLGLYAVFLTWPGMIPFNRIEPLVLGLPFVLFWITLWVALVGVALGILDVAETRAAAGRAGAAADGGDINVAGGNSNPGGGSNAGGGSGHVNTGEAE
ncbi:MAG TPA: hypothetical protein VK929_01055, partial [Longimicrobiales bacterium]|nr:hypothetical protein [Longimicrobiales bacterium]